MVDDLVLGGAVREGMTIRRRASRAGLSRQLALELVVDPSNRDRALRVVEYPVAVRASVGMFHRVVGGQPESTPNTLVSNVSLIVTVPHQIANRYAGAFGLTIAPLPFEMQLPPVSMIWSERNENEVGLDWLRSHISRLCASRATAER